MRHALTDDLCEDALDQLDADGTRVTLSRDEIEPHVATAAAKLLAQRYGGDPGAANWRQMGRLPGFTNRKEIYCEDGLYPWTGLARPVRRDVPPGAAMLIAEARELAASTPASSSSTLVGPVVITQPTPVPNWWTGSTGPCRYRIEAGQTSPLRASW